jgi:hypothetical protein
MPLMAGESRNETCHFKQRFAVNMLAITLLGPLLLMDMSFLFYYSYKKSRTSHQEFLETVSSLHLKIVVFKVLLNVLGFGLWFLLV